MGPVSPVARAQIEAAEQDLAEAETALRRVRAEEAVLARRVNARAFVVATLRINAERAVAGTFDATT